MTDLSKTNAHETHGMKLGTKPADAPAWMDEHDFEFELGPGVWGTFTSSGGPGITKTATGEPVPYVAKAGMILTHRCKNSMTGWDQGAVTFKLPNVGDGQHGWNVESWDPLTLSPSIQSMSYTADRRHVRDDCPLGHGFIRGGKWVSA